MVIVWGAVTVRPEAKDEALRLALEHVHRSRTEPGCLHHSVQVCAEDPLRLVFYEEWADRAALDAHFAVPASGAFVKGIGALATAAPEMKVHPVAAPGG